MFQIDPSWFQMAPWIFPAVIICVLAFIAVTIIWGIRAHRRQVSAGREELIGKTAEVKAALDPKGIVFIQDERWTAISDSGDRVEPGEEVIITKVDGLKLYVTKKQ
ncbi:NfeD family protein [candidate division WOR-3 bacterium]|nr:NfeD family protein [candidate division WOR-3 bacterium]